MKDIDSSLVWDGKDHFLYKNHITMQSPIAIEVFKEFFQHERFDLLIEIGTAGGGWTIFLKEEADKMGAHLISYDIQNYPQKGIEFSIMGIDYRLKNVFHHSQEIIDLIQNDHRVALFCDGGNKIQEFNLFSHYLKSNDFIFTHDYASTYQIFSEEMRGKWWDWCEITDEYIKDAFVTNKFIKYYPEQFKKSAWMAAQKT